MFETFLKFVLSLGTLYLMIAFLPLIVQLTFQVLTSVLSNMFHFDVRPLVNLILLPGSLLRLAFVWVVFEYYGLEFRLKLFFPYFGKPASNLSTDYNYRGLYGSPVKNKQADELPNMKISIIMTFISYSVMLLVVLWVAFRDSINYSLQFMVPSSMVSTVYFFVLFSMLFGGMPVPEETTSTIYVFIMEHPQLVVMLVLDTLGAMILTPYLGVSLTFTYWLLMLLIGFYTWYVYEHSKYVAPPDADAVLDSALIQGV